ncbi:MAG TPA: DUF4173 domain-containing protein [Candidatus Limnocylindrales bacterium]
MNDDVTGTTFPVAGNASDLPGRSVAGRPQATVPPLVEQLPGRTAGRALAALAVGGLIAQLLFYGELLGINFPIWVAFVLGAAVVARRPSARNDRLDAWIPIAALLFASFCAVRTDGMLMLFDVAAAGTFTLAGIVAIGGQPITRRSWHSIVSYAVRAVGVFFFGAVYLANGLRATPRSPVDRQTTPWRMLRGLAYAAPLLIVFGALFAGADAVFGAIVRQLVPVDLAPPDVVGRLILASIAAWLLGGAIVCGLLIRDPDAGSARERAIVRPRIGATEAFVILASMDVLFLVFVALQAAYLFGGVDTLAVSGMTYSDYARRGFGELIVAAALSGIVLIVLGNLVDVRGRTYRLLASTLVLCTGVVVASAYLRITLYQQAYGWTELRFYTVAGIAWLGLCAAIALGTALTGRIAPLPKLVLLTGLLVAVACNLIGPQAFVTQQNVNRAIDPALVAAGGQSGLDVEYLSSLDGDAIRVLAGSVNSLPDDLRTSVAAALSYAHVNLAANAQRGWPSWNYSRQAALDALSAAGN